MARSTLFGSSLWCLTAVNPAIAETPYVITLPPVTVDAPRYSPGESSDYEADNPTLNEYRNTTHLTQLDLAAARERSIDEVLRGLSGIGVTKGGNFGLGVVSSRGAGGQGLLTLDGMPVADTLPGVINVNALLPDGLDSVDVRRGFAPAVRPFSALGGAVDMRSRDARSDGLDLRVEGGTFGFLKETLRGDFVGQSARLAVTVNRSDAFDGAYHAQNANGNPERDPFHGTQTLAKTVIDLSDNVAWEGSLFYRDSRNDMDGYGIRQGMLALADETGSYLAEESWIVQNTLKARLSEDWNTHLQLGYTHTDNHAWLMGIRPGYTTDLYLAHWENDQRLWHGVVDDALHVVWGAEGRYEHAEAPTYSAPPSLVEGAPFYEQRNQQAGFIELRYVYGKLSGDVGVRYESFNRFGAHALVHAGAAWQIAETLKLHANGGNGFRIPSYAEMLFPLLGNPNLTPERGAGGDLGFEWRVSHRLKLDLTGFYRRYDDLIVVSWEPLTGQQIPCVGECVSNVANATVAGLEATGEVTFNTQWRGGVAYTYTDSHNLDNHRRLPFQAPNVVRLWGEWHSSALPLTLWAEGVYRSLAQNDLGNSLDVDDALHVNVYANYRLMPKLDVYVRGENLNNNKTPDVYSIDHAGAAVYGGVLWKM